MKPSICSGLSAFHLLALAICTYIAAIKIESILVTGWICSITGILSGVSAITCKRAILAIACLLTPLIAVLLVILEASTLHLGPGRAALPFCIVFIVNQVIATLTILIELNIMLASKDAGRMQVTLSTMMVAMFSFSVFFAIARYLLVRQHNWLMVLALGLMGLTFVGLFQMVYGLVARQYFAKVTLSKSDGSHEVTSLE